MMLWPEYYYGHWAVIGAILALFGMIFFFIIFFMAYFLGSYVNWRLGKKFGVGSFAEFLIPVYGTMLVCDCAKVSRWLTPLFFLLLVFRQGTPGSLAAICVLICYMVVYGRIARRLGRNPWLWGIISVIFLGIPIMVMAFDSSIPVDGEKTANNGKDSQEPRYIDV